MDKEEKSSHSSIPKQIGASLGQLTEVESSMAMHKALLDLGESLLIYMTGILFGEYKRANNPVYKVEAEFYKFARQKPSFGHFLSFYRLLSGTLEQSILRELYQKNDFPLISSFLLEWVLLKEVVDGGVDSGFSQMTETRKKGRSIGRKGLQDLFDTLVVIRNIYAHPEEKAGSKDEKRKWPIGEEYFNHINDCLKDALMEALDEIVPAILEKHRPVISRRMDEGTGRVTFGLDDTSGSTGEIELELTAEGIDGISEDLRYLLGTDNSLYIQLYYHMIPSVDPSVAREVIAQEKSKQMEPHLRQMVVEKLKNDGLIDAIELLVLRDTAQTAGISDGKLYQMINEACTQLSLEVRAGNPDEPGDVFASVEAEEKEFEFNPWWLKYFAMVPHIDQEVVKKQKAEERELLNKVKELEAKVATLPQNARIDREKQDRKKLRSKKQDVESKIRGTKGEKRLFLNTKLAEINIKIQESFKNQAELDAVLANKSEVINAQMEVVRKELNICSEHSLWGIHRNLWKEMNQYIDSLLRRTLNRSSSESGEIWKNSPNQWQAGRLAYYYWAQIYPEESVLGKLFHIGYSVANKFNWVPRNIEKSLKETLKNPVAILWTSCDDNMGKKVDPQGKLGRKYNELCSDLVERFANELVQLGAHVKVTPNSEGERSEGGDSVDHFMSIESYWKQRDQFTVRQLYSKPWQVDDFYVRGQFNWEAIQVFEKELGVYLQIFANLIHEINDFALINGINAERVRSKMKDFSDEKNFGVLPSE
jgi:hypothetical protein